MLAIYIDAGNDRNGNPKRGWIIADDDGGFKDFIDEGFGGIGNLRQVYGQIASTQRIEVAKSVYKDVYKHAYGGLPSERSQRSPKRGR